MLDGVSQVEQGWIASSSPHDEPSEAVIVHYDPGMISLAVLLDVHLQTHSATVAHAFRGKYRSAVYYYCEEQQKEAESLLCELQTKFGDPLVTKVLPFVEFRPSLPEHRDYYRTDPERPFCRRYIRPKLQRLQTLRPELFSAVKQ